MEAHPNVDKVDYFNRERLFVKQAEPASWCDRTPEYEVYHDYAH